MQEAFFTPFKQNVLAYSLPKRFTFPFWYQPHPLCKLAVQELQHHLTTQTDWQHNFGLVADDAATAIGKMFGVLLVKNKQGEVGYLSAFSGKIAGSNHLPKFVPPVFDSLVEGGFFRTELADITAISVQIEQLQSNPKINQLTAALVAEEAAKAAAVQSHRVVMIAGRKDRKAQRIAAADTLDDAALALLKITLSKQSVQHKNQLQHLTHDWAQRITLIESPLKSLTDPITALKDKRAQNSARLQQKLFAHYRFLNQAGEVKDLSALFQVTTQKVPPAGAGECAAPKLLQYAFKHGMKPLAIAEFWWGQSPKSQVRQHQNFYAACKGKCQPILAHMLAGMEMDENPLLHNPAEGKELEIVYQDEVMVVINKPAEFLSVPGKSIEDSVYTRMKGTFPDATGPIIVHRLDMSTSGLIVIALTKQAHKALQQQFINRTVDKRYIALLAGDIAAEGGRITLPLRVDLDDRPRQLVCYEHGRTAETQWEVIERKVGTTKVYFYPKTGRTHQLRMHAAHAAGLNTPIVGDDLYGTQAERLCLHAELLALDHPISQERMVFQVNSDF